MFLECNYEYINITNLILFFLYKRLLFILQGTDELLNFFLSAKLLEPLKRIKQGISVNYKCVVHFEYR